CAALDVGGEFLRLDDLVDEPPFLRARSAHAFGRRAENVGEIVPHFALVSHARQSAGAGQHAEQRHFGQADRGGAVIDQNDLVAGERDFVAAARGRTVARRDEFEARMPARIFESVARLVREFAEVHFPRVRRFAEHEDVRAGAENPILCARQHDGAYLRMLEAYPLDRIVQLDVDAKIVGVELELVTGTDARVFVDIDLERRNRTVVAYVVMLVPVWMRLIIHGWRRVCIGGGSLHLVLLSFLRFVRRYAVTASRNL